MPTYNRRCFVPNAIEYFLRQDYARSELLVVDDGTDPVGDLVPADPRVRYVGLPSRMSVGAKRNAACELARGDIILHWDDDDWHARHRVRAQVDALSSANADACGLSHLWFYEPIGRRVWEYRYPENAPRWVAGGTLCYRIEVWKQSPFPDVHDGEDSWFVRTLPPDRVLALADNRFYVATVHTSNTAPRAVADPVFVPSPREPLESLLGGDLVDISAACRGVPSRVPCAAHGPITRLNLGCSDARLPGYVNVDIDPRPGIPAVDLRRPWPWADCSIEHVRARDIVEYLPDKIFTMNELWRVLRRGGTAEIAVPTAEGTGALQERARVSSWNRHSFLYYEAGNPYRERFAQAYGISARFRVTNERIEPSVDGSRLTIELEAVKS